MPLDGFWYSEGGWSSEVRTLQNLGVAFLVDVILLIVSDDTTEIEKNGGTIHTIVTTTLVFSGLATRSIAPPIPLTFPGSIKLARSGFLRQRNPVSASM